MHTLLTRTLSIGALSVLLASIPVSSSADRLDELRSQIEERTQQIEELSKDIDKYQDELKEIGEEKRTLQRELDALSLSRKKVETDINLTERQIDRTLLTIEELTLEIEDKQAHIQLNNDTIGETLRRIHEADSQSIVETLLAYENLSDFWEETDTLQQFQVKLTGDMRELVELKRELEDQRTSLVSKQTELSHLRTDLQGQHAVIAANEQETDGLLDVTKNEEANYQALLQEKLRQRDQFLQELRSIEEQLRIEVDPESIPNAGTGVLAWPLDTVRITQHFGNTPFASANPQVYRGAGHNGVDFGASRGTRVKAALSGTVLGTGNTDAVPGCYSYGKWVMLRHNNGLATLYAHLDVISVGQGQEVATGDTIGFSGNTGYSTGPHLHFGVYAAQGVQIEQFSNSINCKNAVIPIAPKEAYLNPLSYLPGV